MIFCTFVWTVTVKLKVAFFKLLVLSAAWFTPCGHALSCHIIPPLNANRTITVSVTAIGRPSLDYCCICVALLLLSKGGVAQQPNHKTNKMFLKKPRKLQLKKVELWDIMNHFLESWWQQLEEIVSGQPLCLFPCDSDSSASRWHTSRRCLRLGFYQGQLLSWDQQNQHRNSLLTSRLPHTFMQLVRPPVYFYWHMLIDFNGAQCPLALTGQPGTGQITQYQVG